MATRTYIIYTDSFKKFTKKKLTTLEIRRKSNTGKKMLTTPKNQSQTQKKRENDRKKQKTK